MSEEKNLKKTNKEQTEQEVVEGNVEGYSYCESHRAKCLNDCGGGGNATPFLSDLN